MTRRLTLPAALLLAGCALLPPLRTGRPDHPAASTSPPLRGLWFTPSAWGSPDADTIRVRLETGIRRAAESGAAAVYFPVRAADGALYPSPLESWSTRVGSKHPGCDPLALAIAASHGHGVALHAALGPGPDPLEDRTHLKAIARHLAETYDLDGLHLSCTGAPQSDLLEDVVAEALLVKPYLLVSVPAPLPDAPRAAAVASPLAGWLARGLADVAVPGPGPDPRPFEVTALPKRARPENVLSLDLSAVVGSSAAGQQVRVQGLARPRTLDTRQCVNLILPALPDTLRLEVAAANLTLPTQWWRPPHRYLVHADSSVTRRPPWVELRAGPTDTTTAAHFPFLFRTDPAAAARVNGDTVHVYRTGVFFDSLSLAAGLNRVRAEVLYPDSSRALYERQYVRVREEPRPALPLWLEELSLEPRRDLVLLPEDVVRVSFRGSPGQRASVRLRPGRFEIPCERRDGDDHSEYRADIPLRQLEPGRVHRIEVAMTTAPGASRSQTLRRELEATIAVQHVDEFPLVRTASDECYLSCGLGRARLGGPYLAEYGPGVVFQTNGRFGNAHRVRLGPQRVGYIPARQVEELPREAVRPSYTIYSLRAALSDSGDADLVTIPWPEPVPYVVSSDPGARRILVTLYGVESSSTWVQHRGGTRYVRQLTWEQPDPETYQVAVHLTDTRIWGYTLRPEGRHLVLRLPHPPVLGAAPAGVDTFAAGEAPFAGLRLAIEAGHGGHNTGAVGLSGLLEKDVNLDTALRLGALCRAAGMEVYQLRSADEGVAYMARRDAAVAWGAHLLVSIHANAGAGRQWYLGLSGASTYCCDPFWAPLARFVCDALLELGLEELGVVGSFNYRITRTTAMPAVLVEQAFMSHAEDEERLADPAFRQRLAEQILAGITDYLEYMLE